MGIYQQILVGKVKFPPYVDTFSKDLIERLLKARIDERLGELELVLSFVCLFVCFSVAFFLQWGKRGLSCGWARTTIVPAKPDC